MAERERVPGTDRHATTVLAGMSALRWQGTLVHDGRYRVEVIEGEAGD